MSLATGKPKSDCKRCDGKGWFYWPGEFGDGEECKCIGTKCKAPSRVKVEFVKLRLNEEQVKRS